MPRLLLPILCCLAFCGLAADTGVLSRLRLQMVLQQMEGENISYTHWVCVGGQRQRLSVCQWNEEDGVSLRREQVKYPEAERDRIHFWGYSREVRYTGEEGTTIAFVGPIHTHLLQMPWHMAYPTFVDYGEFSSLDVSIQGRPHWLIRRLDARRGSAEDFLVERSSTGGRLRRWRRFGQGGRLQEAHLYGQYKELPPEFSTRESFLPPEEGILWEVDTREEYAKTRQEIRSLEEKERRTGNKNAIPRPPRSWDAWKEILVNPVRTPSRRILLILAILAAFLPLLPRLKPHPQKVP
ncbi:MAG: hypothetical protein ACI4SG_07055 [Oligosphaeraceae bacterium]